MNMRAAFKDTVDLAWSRGMAEQKVSGDGSLSFAHLLDMLATVEESDYSEGKLGRWLGWAQAAVVASGAATLDDMKNINMAHASEEATEKAEAPAMWSDAEARLRDVTTVTPEMVARAIKAYKAPRLRVNDTRNDQETDMYAALKAALTTQEQS